MKYIQYLWNYRSNKWLYSYLGFNFIGPITFYAELKEQNKWQNAAKELKSLYKTKGQYPGLRASCELQDFLIKYETDPSKSSTYYR